MRAPPHNSLVGAMNNDTKGTMEDPLNDVPRPLMLTVLCWFLVVSAMINVVMAPALLSSPLSRQMLATAVVPAWAVIAISVISSVIQGVSAGVMLMRRNWGRLVYIAATPLQSLVAYAVYGFQFGGIILLGLVFYGGIVAILMRRDVRAYFANDPSILPVTSGYGARPAAPPVNVGRRIASIALMVPAAMILSTGFLILGALPDLGFGALVMTGIMMVISAVFVVPALYLWGWSRSAIVLGGLMLAVGAELLMIGVVVQQVMDAPQYAAQMKGVDPVIMAEMVRGSFLSGTICAIIGAALIAVQKANDWKNREEDGERM
jgi:hypothetical protein